MSPTGRFESAAPARTGRSRRDTSGRHRERPLSIRSPTFMVAPAAEVKVASMADSVSSPDRGDRLHTLPSRHQRAALSRAPGPGQAGRRLDQRLFHASPCRSCMLRQSKYFGAAVGRSHELVLFAIERCVAAIGKRLSARRRQSTYSGALRVGRGIS